MAHFFVMLTALSLRCPNVETFRDIHWEPHFTEAADIRLQQSTVALLTHCSHRFDPLGETRLAVGRTVAAMKSAGFPVLYLHDRYNDNNPAWMYLYDDWQPTAFVPSDIGHIDLDPGSINHVVCLGGYYGQCERATVADTIRQWYSSGNSDDLRLTQVIDATFTVAQHVNLEDPYRPSVRSLLFEQLRGQHKDAVISVQRILDRIDETSKKVDFLKRQVPAVPRDVNIVMDIGGEVFALQTVGAEARTLTLSYRRSSDVLNQPDVPIDFEVSIRWRRGAGQPASFSISDRGRRRTFTIPGSPDNSAAESPSVPVKPVPAAAAELNTTAGP